MQNKSEYSIDRNFKKIIKNKTLLSYIFHEFVDEYKEVNRKEIESLIHMDNTMHENGKNVISLNGEIEGIRLDSLIGSYLPKQKEKIGMLLNIEMQRSGESIHTLYNRAEFYLSAMIVNQKDSIFENDHYEDIVKVNGIWLCLHKGKHAINQYEVEERHNIGNLKTNKKIYKNNKIIFIYIGDKGEEESLEPLKILFFGGKDVDMKLKTLKEKYDIDLVTEKKEVGEMSRLEEVYQEIYEERGIEIGIQKGIEEGIKQGIEQGIKQGIEQNTIENIKTLMETLNTSYEEVVNLLKLDEYEIKKYRNLTLN